MKEDKILEAYEKMIDNDTKEIIKRDKEINEGKIKNFLGKIKEDF